MILSTVGHATSEPIFFTDEGGGKKYYKMILYRWFTGP